MIDNFKKGYYYKYIAGPVEGWWSDTNKKVCDGRWKKCVIKNERMFKLEGMEKEKYIYENLHCWIESKYPPREKIRRLLSE